jgi:hypothetical protein
MTQELDPTKVLVCYLSFDQALDRESMGADFEKHFGRVGDTYTARYGDRDPKHIKTLIGKRASTFHLRPLRCMERAAVDSLPTAESRWLRALAYAFTKAELSEPLSSHGELILPKSGPSGLDDDALDYLAERVGIEALYEIGAVAYSRSKLSPFGVPYAPLPVMSAVCLVRHLQYLAASQGPTSSSTTTISEE